MDFFGKSSLRLVYILILFASCRNCGTSRHVINNNQRGSVVHDFRDSGDRIELDFGGWQGMRTLGISMSIEGSDFVYSANGETICTIVGAMDQHQAGNLRLVEGGWAIA